MNIKVPVVIWTLGDNEQSTMSGVTVQTRPLYYRAKGSLKSIKVGDINPDYSEEVSNLLEEGNQ